MERIPASAHASNGQLRLPPHNPDAERALLGTMLRERSIIGEVADLVCAEHFYGFGHQQIFTVIVALGERADLVTVAERLTAVNLMDEIGGVSYLAMLPDAAPSHVVGFRVCFFVE